jgi:hypothetical protein
MLPLTRASRTRRMRQGSAQMKPVLYGYVILAIAMKLASRA